MRSLPLAAAGGRAGRRRPRAGELARIAAADGPVRVLVGCATHGDLPGVAGVVRRLGAKPEAFDSIGVLAATVPDGAALVRALRATTRGGLRGARRQAASRRRPARLVDPVTGVKYTWFYDDVRAADALLAAGGGSRRSIAVMDTGLDVTHPEFAGRIARTYDTFTRGRT